MKGDEMQEAKKPNAAVVAVIVVVLLAAVAGGTVYLLNRQNETGTEGQTNTSNTSEQQTPETPSSTASYKDGTYTATGSYLSPGGQESVDVEVTLKGGVIESATVTPHPASTTSTQYQGEFVSNFKPLVVGKSIDDVKLSRVAGSSLTSGGFNEAIEKIKDDAAA